MRQRISQKEATTSNTTFPIRGRLKKIFACCSVHCAHGKSFTIPKLDVRTAHGTSAYPFFPQLLHISFNNGDIV